MEETRKPRKKTTRAHSWGRLGAFFSSSGKPRRRHGEEEPRRRRWRRRKRMWVRFGCSVFLLCNSKNSCRVVMRKAQISSTRKIIKTSVVEKIDTDTSLFSSFSSSSLASSSLASSLTSVTAAAATSPSSLDGSFRRNTVTPNCSDCGAMFTKSEGLEAHHQTVCHAAAVTELGPEDPSRSIVEIIFGSSWLSLKKPAAPACKIERVIKINNTQKKITEFEDYRDYIKNKTGSTNKYPRCAVDGNEVLRFHSTIFSTACSICSKDGTTRLCSSINPQCAVCSIIKDGFKVDGAGRICTLGAGCRSSLVMKDEKRAMLVCRVIAGWVRKVDQLDGIGGDDLEEYDSLASSSSSSSSRDQLFLFNPKAILACFLVIY